MSDGLKIQGEVSLSTSGADAALDRLGSKAGQMAVNMAEAGAKAGKAVDQIGEIAKETGEKFTRAESGIVSSIKRLAVEAAKAKDVTQQLGNIEFNIAAKGLDSSKFKPMLAVVEQLANEYRGLAQAQNQAGNSSAINAQKMNAAFGPGLTNNIKNTSYQLQDLIVQMNGGVDASKALGQQLPQMLVGFGAMGAAIGVVAALLPNLVSAFSDTADGAKNFSGAMSDFDKAIGEVGATTKAFDMEKLYDEFNKSSAAVRNATLEQLNFQREYIRTTQLVAEKKFGESIGGFGDYSTLDKLAGSFAGSGSEKLSKQLGVSLDVAKDLLPVLNGLKNGTEDVGLAFDKFGTLLLGGNQKAVDLATSMATLAKSERDAAAASSAISEAQAKMAKGHVTTKKEAEETAKARDAAAKAAQKEAEELARLLDRINGKDTGLDASYWSDLEKLHKWFQKSGDIDAYRVSVEKLTKQQKFYTDSLKEAEKAEEARSKYLASIESETEKLVEKAKAAEYETSLIGKSTEEIERLTAARYDERIELLQEKADAIVAIEGRNAEVEAIERQIDALGRLKNAETDKVRFKGAEDALKKLESSIEKTQKKMAFSGLKNAFTGLDKPVGSLIDKFQQLIDIQDEFGKQSAEIAKMKNGNAEQQAKALELEGKLQSKNYDAQIGTYGDLAGAAKGFFDQHSKGYAAMEAAEKTFRAFQLASSAQAMARTMMEGQANAVTGVANQAKGDPYTAFPRMAAMAAIMAALGFATGAFGGGGDQRNIAQDAQSSQGTGTILGDAAAKSKSIEKALERLNDIDTMTMRYSAQMASSLKVIENNISGFATLLFRSTTASTGKLPGLTLDAPHSVMSDTWADGTTKSLIMTDREVTKLLGMNSSPIESLTRSITNGLFGKVTQSITNSGVDLGAGTIADYIDKAVNLREFATVETKTKSWFGSKAELSDAYGQLDDEFYRQVSGIFTGLSKSIQAAAGALNLDASALYQQALESAVSIGQISLNGMKADEAQEALNNVFSAMFDRVAESVFPSVTEFQQVGEGMYETVIRVASAYETATVALDQLGVSTIAYGDLAAKTAEDLGSQYVRESLIAYESMLNVGDGISNIIAAIDGSASELADTYRSLVDLRSGIVALGMAAQGVGVSMIQGAGSLDALMSGVEDYVSNYLSESEQAAYRTEVLSAQFERLGLVMPGSVEGFRSLVESLDLTTEAGSETFGKLMQVAGAFYDVADAAQKQYETQYQGAIDATDAAMEALKRSVEAEKEVYQARADAARELASEIQGVFDTLESSIQSLYGTVAPEMQAAQGRAFVSDALNSAKTTGYLPNSSDLSAAIEAVNRSFNSRNYASAQDQKIAQMQFAGQLIELQKVSSSKLSGAELAAKAAEDQISALNTLIDDYQSQIDAIRGIDGSVKSVQQAIADLQKALVDELKVQGLALQAKASELLSSINRSFTELDSDISGFLSFDELKSALGPLATDSTINGLIDAVDLNGDNQISKLEALISSSTSDTTKMLAVLNGMNVDSLTYEQVKSALSPLWPSGTIDSLLKGIDKDGDLVISRLEISNQKLAGMATGILGLLQNGGISSQSASSALVSAGTSTDTVTPYTPTGTNTTTSTGSTSGAGTTSGTYLVTPYGSVITDTRVSLINGWSGTPQEAKNWLVSYSQQSTPAQMWDMMKNTLGLSAAAMDYLFGWPSGNSLEWARQNNLPAFKSGGNYQGGLALVGEEGPELINFRQPGQVYTAAQTSNLLNGDNAELVEEIRALREENQAHASALVSVNKRLAKIFERWDGTGIPETRVTA